jgi:actin-like ATPase involved in cell morphogenesis
VREARRYLRDGKDVLFDSELLLQHLFENGFSSGSRIKAYEVLTKRISAGNATEAGFTSLEITQGVKPVLKRIAEEVKDSLNVLTPDQLDNLSREGIYLCGEAADIKGFADKLADCMGMPIHISDKSGAAAITGIGSLLEDLDTIGRVLEKALE